jgi:hypothetical protein
MIKRLIVAAIAVVFFVLQFNLNGASALELNEKTLTITLNDAGESVTLTSEQATEGQKLFVANCTKCHLQGKTKTNNAGGINGGISNGNDIISNAWRENFEIYKSGLRDSYNSLKSNKAWILEREKFHPNLDILLTLKKSCVDYWDTEKGWKNKNASK